MAHPPVTRSGNAPPPETQLQKVIERQRVLIQNLQKENAILAAERDGLKDRVLYLEQQLARKDRILVADDSAEGGPTPPPRSPWRAARASESSDGDRSASPATLPPQSPTSPQAIIEKDAQTFARYQSAVRYKSASPPPIVMPTASKSSSVVDTRFRRPPSPQQQQQQQQQQPAFLKESKRSSTAPPSAFLADSNVTVKVVGSTIKMNDKGREVIAFVISVRKAHGEELWRVEKLYSDFLALDAKIKVRGEKVGKLHDKQIFSSSRAPSKIDQRKIVLEQYLQHVIASPSVNLEEVCEFLTTNILEREEQKKSKNKAGYLIKRGKNFGGWKIRYFAINGDVLEYFESKDGAYLGAIKLTNAQLGRQAAPTTPEFVESSYRHAFLIVEQKRLGSSGTIKHILCANSDEERDAWIDALLENIRLEDTDKKNNSNNNNNSKKAKKVSKIDIRPVAAAPIKAMAKKAQGVDMNKLTNVPEMQIPTHPTEVPVPQQQQQQQQYPSTNNGPTPSVSSESGDSATAEARTQQSPPPQSPVPPPHQQPVVRSSFEQHYAGRTLTPVHPVSRRCSTSNLGNTVHEEEPAYDPKSRSNMLSPTPGALRSSDDLLDINAEKKSKQKANRVTIWGKKMFSGTSEPVAKGSEIISSVPSGFRNFLSRTSNDSGFEQQRASEDKGRQVFGVPLEEAVQNSRIKEGYELPAIVHRCIEYLDAKKAVMEEGLYRLSGSNTVILALKQRFNQEGDVNLLASGEDYDVHAVAGLLKLWLRELPSNVLTDQMKSEFLHVIDLLDHKDRVIELGKLVSQLPLANYTLLRALTAHLICVVQHADVNKMNIWNINMVFSLTLDIPATIIRLFMSEFEYIFWTTEDGNVAPRMMEDDGQGDKQEEAENSNKQGIKEEGGAAKDKQDTPSTPLPGKFMRNPTLRRLKEEEGGRSNRNSVHYVESAPHAVVDMEKHPDGPPMLDDGDEGADDLELLMTEETPDDMEQEEKSDPTSALQVPVASPPPRRPSA